MILFARHRDEVMLFQLSFSLPETAGGGVGWLTGGTLSELFHHEEGGSPGGGEGGVAGVCKNASVGVKWDERHENMRNEPASISKAWKSCTPF